MVDLEGGGAALRSGLMQDWPLTVDRIITHAERTTPLTAVVTRAADGSLRRTGYAQIADGARAVSRALRAVGISEGDRVATLAWNGDRHMESWYGISGMGAVCHPLNPRFTPAQLAWIAGHAGDRILVLDLDFLPLIEGMAANLPGIERFVVMTDGRPLPSTALPAETWDAFLARGQGQADVAWGAFAEDAACALFYTSGTTGDPKGVLYSHRSNVLHAMMLGLGYDFGRRDVIMPVVPMFHANGWGLPYLAPMLGVPLIMPGAALDGPSLQRLMVSEAVTVAAGVPTLWTALLAQLRTAGGGLNEVRRLYSAGAATPPSLIQAFADEFGVAVIPAWGMTEMSPSGTVGGAASADAADGPERFRSKARQGRFVFGVEGRVVDEERVPVAADGASVGTLEVRGGCVVRRYAGAEQDAVDAAGWFDTGDMAVLHSDGALEITDRTKDVIKSGGEWISSVTIEQIASAHSAVEMCAVIGVPDERWDERPLLVVKRRECATLDQDEILLALAPYLPRWWIPDAVVFLDTLPLGSTGKVDKKLLRAIFAQRV